MGNSPGKEAVPAPQPPQPPAKQARVEAPSDGDKKLAKAAEVQRFERDKKAGESCVRLRGAPRGRHHKNAA